MIQQRGDAEGVSSRNMRLPLQIRPVETWSTWNMLLAAQAAVDKLMRDLPVRANGRGAFLVNVDGEGDGARGVLRGRRDVDRKNAGRRFIGVGGRGGAATNTG